MNDETFCYLAPDSSWGVYGETWRLEHIELLGEPLLVLPEIQRIPR